MTHPTVGHTSDGKPLRLDVETLMETRLLIQGASGSGKSNAARLLVEQIHPSVQCVVIDPEGEYATLREKFPFALIGPGGEGAAVPRSAGRAARLLLELRESTVIDLHELKAHERTEYVKGWCESLMSAPHELLHDLVVVLEEAQLFAPQSGSSAQSAAGVIDLATRGRKKGFCLWVVTQRISDVEKSVVAQCGNRLVGLTTLDTDVKRALYELGFGTTKDDRARLTTLERGQFHAYGPAFSGKGVTFVDVDEAQTKPPPRRRAGGARPPPPTPEKLRSALERLADLPKEAEQEIRDLDQAKARIRELERIAKAKPAAPAPAPAKVERVEVPVLSKRDAAAVARLEEKAGGLLARVDDLLGAAGAIRGAAIALKDATQQLNVRTAEALRAGAPPPRPVAAPAAAARQVDVEPTEGLSRPQQRILDSLAWLEGVRIPQANRTQLALLSEASPASSSYQNNLGTLRTQGLIAYPPGGFVQLTDAGRSRACADVPRTTEEMHASILGKLPRPKADILRTLIEIHPRTISREDLAGRVEASAASSSFQNNLGSLRTLGLIEYAPDRSVFAQPVLFLEGAA